MLPRPHNPGRAFAFPYRGACGSAKESCLSKNIYVGNLSFETTSDNLRDIFAEHGSVDRAQVATDRDTGRSRGFGFVEMREGGEVAIAALNGAEYQGRALKVNEAKPREERPRTGGYARQN